MHSLKFISEHQQLMANTVQNTQNLSTVCGFAAPYCHVFGVVWLNDGVWTGEWI
jgi:hypothetical protein